MTNWDAKSQGFHMMENSVTRLYTYIYNHIHDCTHVYPIYRCMYMYIHIIIYLYMYTWFLYHIFAFMQ